jgi:hypothetical protein
MVAWRCVLQRGQNSCLDKGIGLNVDAGGVPAIRWLPFHHLAASGGAGGTSADLLSEQPSVQ